MSPSASITPSHELELAVERLLNEARRARAAVEVFDGTGDPESARYSDAVATTLAAMELDLRIARAALTARCSEHPDDLRQSVREVAEAARVWHDDLAVQTALGRMEWRDRSGALAGRLERATSTATKASDDLAAKFGTDLDSMRRTATDAIRTIRGVLTEAVSVVSDATT